MGECNVCFDVFESARAHMMERYFMPCGCRIPLCDECTPKVARQARCLWCRHARWPALSEFESTFPRDNDFETMVSVLNVANNTIQTLRAQLRDMAWSNIVLRVEMFHFKRHRRYRSWGFFLGCMGGFIFACGTHVVLGVAMFALTLLHIHHDADHVYMQLH